MGYLTAKQFSEKWGISERRIIKLCNENRISGAIKNGMIWVIPEDTIKPIDKRRKIAEFINTQKRVMIVNMNSKITEKLIPLLQKEGYIVEGIYNKNLSIKNSFNSIQTFKVDFENDIELEDMFDKTSKYYDGLIILEDIKDLVLNKNKEKMIEKFAVKMNCNSSIVLVNIEKDNIVEKMSDKLKRNIGIRINSLNIEIKSNKNILFNYEEIAEDVLALLTKFKNTTGMSIQTDGGAIVFDENGRTKPLETGDFYRVLDTYFNSLDKNSTMWAASTMLEDEWTEEPLEMQFRVNNLDAASRGANIERIFIFSKTKINEFKNNKTLKIYMQNANINTMFVDYDEVMEKEPELFDILGSGWDGFNENTLILDLPEGSLGRGYVSINIEEVRKAKKCFERLKSYSKDLKEILK